MIIIIFILVINIGLAQDKGRSAYDNEDYGGARLFYENILKKRKNDDYAKFGLGVSAYKQKDINL